MLTGPTQYFLAVSGSKMNKLKWSHVGDAIRYLEAQADTQYIVAKSHQHGAVDQRSTGVLEVKVELH